MRPPVIAGPLRSLWLAGVERLAADNPLPPHRPDAVILDVAGCADPGSLSLAGALARARALARHQVLVRLSPLAAGRAEAELGAIGPEAPDGLLLAGCTGAADLQRCATKLAVREAEAGWPAGSVGLLASVDAAGLLALGAIAHPRLAGLVLDDGAGLGAAVAPLTRMLLLLGAQAAGVPAYVLLGEDDPTAIPPGFAGALRREIAAADTA